MLHYFYNRLEKFFTTKMMVGCFFSLFVVCVHLNKNQQTLSWKIFLTNIFFILHLLPLPRLLPPPPLLPRHLKIRMLVKKTQFFFYKVTCDRCFLLDHWNLLSLKIFKNKYFFNIFLINDIFQIYITSIFKSLLVKEKSSGNIC